MFGYDGYGCGMGGWGVGGWGMGMMIVMMLVWFLLIVIVAYALLHWLNGIWPHRQDEKMAVSEKTSLKTLEERYARGEVDREEFLQKRNDLAGK